MHQKENFRPVDGALLLARLESLPITQWNYRADGEAVKHIGPTAQDFFAAFGVGADDEAISTIDLSGVALAAIKELARQDHELSLANTELRLQMESLRLMLREVMDE